MKIRHNLKCITNILIAFETVVEIDYKLFSVTFTFVHNLSLCLSLCLFIFLSICVSASVSVSLALSLSLSRLSLWLVAVAVPRSCHVLIHHPVGLLSFTHARPRPPTQPPPAPRQAALVAAEDRLRRTARNLEARLRATAQIDSSAAVVGGIRTARSLPPGSLVNLRPRTLRLWWELWALTCFIDLQ